MSKEPREKFSKRVPFLDSDGVRKDLYLTKTQYDTLERIQAKLQENLGKRNKDVGFSYLRLMVNGSSFEVPYFLKTVNKSLTLRFLEEYWHRYPPTNQAQMPPMSFQEIYRMFIEWAGNLIFQDNKNWTPQMKKGNFKPTKQTLTTKDHEKLVELIRQSSKIEIELGKLIETELGKSKKYSRHSKIIRRQHSLAQQPFTNAFIEELTELEARKKKANKNNKKAKK
ncbi:MAG: hypothetical protein V1914_02485 [archaeon]